MKAKFVVAANVVLFVLLALATAAATTVEREVFCELKERALADGDQG